MTDGDPIRRVLGPNGDSVCETWMNSNVAMCIVSTKKKNPKLSEDKNIKLFKKLGIEVEVLEHPAVPTYVRNTTKLATPEWELALTPEWRTRMEYEHINAAIAIAHLRAIRQCTAASKKWVWIMEEDGEPTNHFATGIIAAFLALSGSPKSKSKIHNDPPSVIYLCSSNHSDRQTINLSSAPILWKLSPSWKQPGLPMLRSLTPDVNKRSHWVGQGARGYILHPDFAQFLQEQRIQNHWDLHMMDMLLKYKGKAAIVYPVTIVNAIQPSLPARGSARLQSYFGVDGEQVTDYILLNLEKGWGLWNRVRTIIWAMFLADFHHLGLFVIWNVSPACDMKFDEIFPSFATKFKEFIKNSQEWCLPFVKIISYEFDSQYHESFKISMYLAASLTCQASVPAAMMHIKSTMTELMKGHSLQYKDKDLTCLWKLFTLNDQGNNNAKVYLEQCQQKFYTSKQQHVAIYCRRNDMVQLIRDKIRDKFEDLDNEMWSEVDKAVQNGYIVHFITDSKDYTNEAWNRYKNQISYGLNWNKLKDTRGRMCVRSSNLQDAIDNFCILQNCMLVYACKSSSLLDWLVYQKCKIKYFETTTKYTWHPLTKAAFNDIKNALKNLYNLHYTGWHLLNDTGSMKISMMQLAIIRKLTDRNLYNLLLFLNANDVQPNDMKQRTLAQIGQWISVAEANKNSSMLQIFENRREYKDLTPSDLNQQGWLSAVTRIIFFDYLMKNYNIKICFSNIASNTPAIRFTYEGDGSFPKLSWEDCKTDFHRLYWADEANSPPRKKQKHY